jgi:hypothetical protein
LFLIRIAEKNRLDTDHLVAGSSTASAHADEANPFQVLSGNERFQRAAEMATLSIPARDNEINNITKFPECA